MALFNETPLSQIVREQSLGEPDPLLRQYTPNLGDAAFRRGIDQSLGLGADYLGTLAETAGQGGAAQDLYGFTDERMRQAQLQQAGPQTLGDVSGPTSAFEFGLNKAVESLPVSATAIGAGLLARNLSVPARIASAAAPIFPVVAGETSFAMRQDPNSTATVGERALASTGAGAVGSALEVLPELGAVSGLVRPAVTTAAKTMAEAVLRGTGTAGKIIGAEALTEGAQDVVSRTAQAQFNPAIQTNPITEPEARESFLESAAAGAAGGALFGGPAGVATTLQSTPSLDVPSLPESEQLRQFIGDRLTPRAERIAPEDIPANFDDAVAGEMQREQSLTDRARALRDRLLQRGDLTPEETASIQDEVDLDPDAQEAVLDLNDKKVVDDAIQESLARVPQPEGKLSRVSPEIPLEEVDTIIEQAGITEQGANPLVRRWLAAYKPQLESGDISTSAIDDALNIFGERGYSVLRVLAGENQNAQDAIDADQARNGQLDDFLFQALKPEYRDSIRPNQLRQLGNLVRGSVQRGEGDTNEILATAFQNPDEVMRGLDTIERNVDQGVAQQQSFGEDGAETEVGDTQSVQDVEKRIFGDTRRNRRIKTGGVGEMRNGKFVHTLPWPMSKDEFADIVEVAKNTRGLAPESDIIEVPATTTLRELGVDPADVAAEMGTTVDALRNMVFLQGSAPKAVTSTKTFVRMLKKSTVEQLNNEPLNPSAGSYLGIKTGNNLKAAIDVRRMISAQTFGDRTSEALIRAFGQGVATALEQGYKLDGPIPDSLVLARYGSGADATTITLGEARDALGKREASSSEGNFAVGPETYNTLQENGYDPRIDFETGDLFLPKKDVQRIIEQYTAAVASRNSAARGTPVPAWTQKLIDKHGTDFPAAFGRRSDASSLIATAISWAQQNGVDSKALSALTVDKTDKRPEKQKKSADAVQARRELEAEERAGPATGEIESDPDTAPASVIEAEAGFTNPQTGEITPREGAAARTPERPYKVRGKDKREDFFITAEKAAAAHVKQFWATGEVPSGIDLKGPYAVLGKLAARGEPLQVVVAKSSGATITPDIQRLIEAYQRRGFNIRVTNNVTANIIDAPYSERVISRVLGPTGDNPAHVVMTIGDGPSARLARRIGIPIIDLTNPVQQKIAGDILRSYDRGRRQDISRSNEPKEAKDFRREGEKRSGTDRSRDLLAVMIEKELAANWNNPEMVDRLLRVSGLSARADNDFFDAGLAGREPSALASTIDALETYERQYNKEQGKPSRTKTSAEQVASEEEFARAKEYIASVLPGVNFNVTEATEYSGHFGALKDNEGNVGIAFLNISKFSVDPMSVAFHESMHGLIASLNNQTEKSAFVKVLLKAANSPLVMSRLRTLLKDEPAALQQMVTDPEERIAYMYQFWAAGQLELTSGVENWFVKLTQAIRGILGILSNDQKAVMYSQAFRDGKLRKPSAVNNVVMQSLSGPERALRAVPVAKTVAKIANKVFQTSHGRLKSYGNPALDKIADAFFADSTVGGQRSGYLQTTRDVVNMFGSQFNEVMRGSTQDTMTDLAAALHSNIRPKDKEQAERYDNVKRLMRRMYNYMKDSGVEVARVKDYFPQAWDKTAIDRDRAGFEAMLVANAKYRDGEGGLLPFTPSSAAITTETLLGDNGRLELQEDLAGFSPFMESTNVREILLDNRADAVQFMDHDVVKIVTRYITQAAKRGEYVRHFGEYVQVSKGKRSNKLSEWLEEAKTFGITDEELKHDIAPAIQAMEGTLGHDINPIARDAMSGMVTVLNLAILPLAVFSSLIDPMGITVRGGTMDDAWSAFKAGIRNIPASVRKNGKKLDIQEFAESVGTVESQFTLDMLGDMYGSAYMSDWARNTNNLLFRYNLMEGWNTAMRSSATIAALSFIKRHMAGENEHSARYMDELGLDSSNVVLDEAGNVLWKQADIADRLLQTGGDPVRAQEISRRTREAITRWVDGAVLRPHAAHRPAWASDPWYMLVWHLKQFTYSFQKTIIERVMHESRNGNYNPLLTLSAYVPFMIAADFLRGFVQGAGEEPEWRKGMTFGETVWEGVQRSGLLGVRQFVVDGAENPAFALGPAANYAIGFADKAADGEVEDALVKILPGNALWKGW